MKRPLPTADEALRILAAKRSRPSRRSAPPAGKALAGLIRALDARFGQGPGALQARWKDIVGETLAARTEPVKLSKPRAVTGMASPGAVLELRVDGAAAALIQHQSADIIARVNVFLGPGAVGKLRIVQGPVKARINAPAKASNAVKTRRRLAPVDAAAEADLQTGLAKAADGPLKTALTRLGREVLRNTERGER
jgi:hypothetical protein